MNDESGIPTHLLGNPFPPPRAVGPGRISRDWRVRTSEELPFREALVSALAALEKNVNELLRVQFGTSHRLSRVNLSAYYIDNRHLIVSVETEDILDDVEFFSQFAVIDALDELFVLTDLQGIPADRWLEIRRARSARTQR